jgi:hypothetical protein
LTRLEIVSLFVRRRADFPYYRWENVGFESPSLRQFSFDEISSQATCFGLGAELNPANRFHGFLNSTANAFSAI